MFVEANPIYSRPTNQLSFDPMTSLLSAHFLSGYPLSMSSSLLNEQQKSQLLPSMLFANANAAAAAAAAAGKNKPSPWYPWSLTTLSPTALLSGNTNISDINFSSIFASNKESKE
ncbi:hypothetical protein BLA29_009412, partial [Euroglyphus maynei]